MFVTLYLFASLATPIQSWDWDERYAPEGVQAAEPAAAGMSAMQACIALRDGIKAKHPSLSLECRTDS